MRNAGHEKKLKIKKFIESNVLLEKLSEGLTRVCQIWYEHSNLIEQT